MALQQLQSQEREMMSASSHPDRYELEKALIITRQMYSTLHEYVIKYGSPELVNAAIVVLEQGHQLQKN